MLMMMIMIVRIIIIVIIIIRIITKSTHLWEAWASQGNIERCQNGMSNEQPWNNRNLRVKLNWNDIPLTWLKMRRSFRASIPWLISSTTRNGTWERKSRLKRENHARKGSFRPQPQLFLDSFLFFFLAVVGFFKTKILSDRIRKRKTIDEWIDYETKLHTTHRYQFILE